MTENTLACEHPSSPIGVSWLEAISGRGVVCFHDFAHEQEVYNHLDLAKSGVAANASAPGGYTLNRSTAFGVHDSRLNAFRVPCDYSSSGYALRIRQLGGRLAEDIDSTQAYAHIVDASGWPDPGDDPAKFYFVSIHADNSNPQYYPDNAKPGAKGLKECAVVRKVTGNTVYFAGRGCSYSESAQTGGIAAKAFKAGCPIGKDVAGGWARPLMALDAASSGRCVDDPAAGGTMKVRAKPPRGKMKQGYHADPFYARHPQFVGEEFDGDEFWVQFGLYIDPARRSPDVPGGKLLFIDPLEGGGQQQIVASGPSEFDGIVSFFGDFGGERYSPDNFLQPITNEDGSISSNFPTCKVGAKSECMEWPLGEPFRVMIRVRPGYSMDAACPSLGAGKDTENALVVDTTHFSPTNQVEADGVRRLRFETTLPPLFDYFPSPEVPGLDGGTFNRHSPGYFSGGGWVYDWPTTATGTTWPKPANQFAGGTALCESCEVIDRPTGSRMRWSFVKRGATAFTSAVPSHGHKMQLDVWDRSKAFPLDYLRHEIDVWVKRRGETPVQVYGLAKYIIVFGTGVNKFNVNPPGYSEFKATGYSNVWDNLAPHPSCTFVDFTDWILSHEFIPWAEISA